MKPFIFLIAGVALAGCDITFGSNGPVITQSDSMVSQVVPLGSRTTPNAAQTTPAATQTAASTDQSTPNRTRIPITVSGINATTALPLGVTRNQVDVFREAVANAGCIISTPTQRAAIKSQTGFDTEKLDLIVGYLWRRAEMDRNSGSYTLTSGRCSDA